MHPVIPYVTAALLFGLGVYGVLRRRNAVLVLMAVELMLNAVNLVLVTADATVPRRAAAHRRRCSRCSSSCWPPPRSASGLAIVLQLYRLRAQRRRRRGAAGRAPRDARARRDDARRRRAEAAPGEPA